MSSLLEKKENSHVDGMKPLGLYPINFTKRDMFLYIYVSENIDSAAAVFMQYVSPWNKYAQRSIKTAMLDPS